MRLKLAATLLSAIIFAIAVFNTASADDPFEDAAAAYLGGDHATAISFAVLKARG